MSIANESRQRIPICTGEAADIVSLAAVADNLAAFLFLAAATVLRIGVHITTACTVTAPVVDFDRRITYGSDTGRVDKGVGTLTFPAVASCVIGAIIYKEVEADINPGDQVMVQVTTAASAGAGIPFLEYINRHEAAANQSDMVLGT